MPLPTERPIGRVVDPEACRRSPRRWPGGVRHPGSRQRWPAVRDRATDLARPRTSRGRGPERAGDRLAWAAPPPRSGSVRGLADPTPRQRLLRGPPPHPSTRCTRSDPAGRRTCWPRPSWRRLPRRPDQLRLAPPSRPASTCRPGYPLPKLH